MSQIDVYTHDAESYEYDLQNARQYNEYHQHDSLIEFDTLDGSKGFAEYLRVLDVWQIGLLE